MNDSLTRKPLITFALFAYNQEEFIKEAVISTFSQTYSPLEIILSDDCSNDNTFSIMEDLASNYSGPHIIKLNRNPVNLGIGSHVNKLVELAAGELIVAGAGDDISENNRVDVIADKWLTSEKEIFSIHSYASVINKNSEMIGINKSAQHQYLENAESFLKGDARLLGATHAFSKKVFEQFGPLNDKVVYEDTVIPFRSLLLGSVLYIDQPLVRHRIGGISNSYALLNEFNLHESLYSKTQLLAKRAIACSKQRTKDIKKINAPDELLTLEEKRLAQLILMEDLSNKRNIIKSMIKAFFKGAGFYYTTRFSLKYIFPEVYRKHMLRKYQEQSR